MRKGMALLAALLIVALTGACSDGGTSSAGEHNKADVKFATDMIPHHAQAIEMAKFAATRASDPKVKSLAEKIEKAQDPEIKTMSGWLKSWGEKVPTTDGAHGGGHESMDMPGMMSAGQMAALEKLSGPAFDRMFLQMMTEHHEGAIEMAKTEQKDGKSPDAKALAAEIEKAQTAEIKEMATLLGG